jgi:hypothetical protein
MRRRRRIESFVEAAGEYWKRKSEGNGGEKRNDEKSKKQ